MSFGATKAILERLAGIGIGQTFAAALAGRLPQPLQPVLIEIVFAFLPMAAFQAPCPTQHFITLGIPLMSFAAAKPVTVITARIGVG